MKLMILETIWIALLVAGSHIYASGKSISARESHKPRAEVENNKEASTHGDSEKDHDHEHEDDHEDDHEDEHEHEHEENNLVGPGKGIISASADEGIQISPEAEKNFEIKRMSVPAATTFDIPRAAIVTAGIEVNIYRYRQGHYKRIDITVIEKKKAQVAIKAKDLKPGDEIVIQGMGLLRIAEIAAFGGAPEGHSH